MLIQELSIMQTSQLLGMVASLGKRSNHAKELQFGVYEIGHFGSTTWLTGYDNCPDLPIADGYGVCDNVEQIFEKCPEIKKDKNRQFVITMTPMHRENEPMNHGWRWNRWGEYIGTQDPQHEYLFDEQDIDLVYVFHVYEKLKEGKNDD